MDADDDRIGASAVVTTYHHDAGLGDIRDEAAVKGCPV